MQIKKCAEHSFGEFSTPVAANVPPRFLGSRATSYSQASSNLLRCLDECLRVCQNNTWLAPVNDAHIARLTFLGLKHPNIKLIA